MTIQSAEAVRNLIIDRMTTGMYPLGSQLPTSRELASEIGVHRNTAAKAYQMLADVALVTTQRGRGTFVIARPNDAENGSVASQVLRNVTDLVVQARRIGIPEDELRTAVDQQIAAAYRASKRGVYIECNMGDVEAGIAEIETMTGVRLSPLLLKSVVTNSARAIDGYDIVVTSLIHHKEVSDLLELSHPDLRIIGLYTRPDEEAMARIAQVQPGSCVGIVVDIPEGARRFESQINTVTSVTTRALITPDDQAIRDLAETVDVIVCSHSRASQVRALELPVSIIELKFHVSWQSAPRILEALIGDERSVFAQTGSM